jgi:tRNA pseudouridine55 synthase
VITGLDKEYYADFMFGTETDTLDPEGVPVKETPLPDITAIIEKIKGFKGRIEQIPPDYSAVHVKGKRAYQIARRGESPDIPKRTVTVYEIDIKDYAAPVLTVSIRCSSGTYVRSIARDLGRACGSAAYVSRLRRTAVGPFSVKEAVSPDSFDPDSHLFSAIDFLQRLPEVHLVTIQPPREGMLKNGGRLHPDAFSPRPESDGIYAVQDTCRQFKSLIKRENGTIRYLFNYG